MNSVRKVGLAAALAFAATTALAAPTALAGGFVADQYPATVSATPTTTPGDMMFGVAQSCGWELGMATLSEPESLATPVSETRCGSPVKTNTCEIAFHPGSGAAGTIDIGPSGCKPIEVTVKTCQYTIPAQSFSATYENVGSGSTAAVLAEVETFKFKYSGCGSQTLKETGTYLDSWEFTATDAGGESIGLHAAASAIYLDGDESAEPGKQPKANTEWSAGWSGATPLSGAATSSHTLQTGIRSFTCNTVDLDGTLETEVTQGAGFTLWPEYRNCTGNASLVDVDASACYYWVNVLNVGPPYAGGLDIVCDPGKGIEVKFYSSEQNKAEGKTFCVLRVPSQELPNGVGLENIGSGFDRGLAMKLNLTGVTWTVVSGGVGFCGKGNSKATYTGSSSVFGLQ